MAPASKVAHPETVTVSVFPHGTYHGTRACIFLILVHLPQPQCKPRPRIFLLFLTQPFAEKLVPGTRVNASNEWSPSFHWTSEGYISWLARLWAPCLEICFMFQLLTCLAVSCWGWLSPDSSSLVTKEGHSVFLCHLVLEAPTKKWVSDTLHLHTSLFPG